jgi:hypothetical protein
MNCLSHQESRAGGQQMAVSAATLPTLQRIFSLVEK